MNPFAYSHSYVSDHLLMYRQARCHSCLTNLKIPSEDPNMEKIGPVNFPNGDLCHA